MAKTFGVDPAKGIAAILSDIPAPTTTGLVQHRGKKTRGPGLPPTVRGLPWSKMLRSFREKSS